MSTTRRPIEKKTDPRPGLSRAYENKVWRDAAIRSGSDKMYQVDNNNTGYYTPTRKSTREDR